MKSSKTGRRKRISKKGHTEIKKEGDAEVPLEAIYAAFGKAILYSHYLERQVALFVACWNALKNRHDDRRFVEYLDGLTARTFGQVIQAGIENGAISEEMLAALKPAKEMRNLLVHRTIESLPLRLATILGPIDVFEELWDVADLIKGIADEISDHAMFCSELRGISPELVERKARDVINRASKLDRLGLVQGAH